MPQVLIVDDDEDIRVVLRIALEDAGYAVHEAANGAAALDVLRQADSAMVVLVDYVMPRVDGAGLLDAAAALPPSAPQHAYILITASPQRLSPDFTAQLDARGVMVISKPFDMTAILEVVARASAQLVQVP
jgi:two-component system, chemotaxis family, chemotaxis protein CheY